MGTLYLYRQRDNLGVAMHSTMYSVMSFWSTTVGYAFYIYIYMFVCFCFVISSQRSVAARGGMYVPNILNRLKEAGIDRIRLEYVRIVLNRLK